MADKLTKEQKDALKFMARLVLALTTFMLVDYFIDASDTSRFVVGPLAPFAELIICSGAAVAAFLYSKNL